uniref:Uncharacterized protein n=1 Tax=Candidatus Kentrum sp. TUN TaxID=2126343 RepID=A0A451A149_9GAMM|nr:MAG: hypothetical protein BECKTUN1418D_GA0071000_11083 [Candidatus Kentron sp. TUN]
MDGVILIYLDVGMHSAVGMSETSTNINPDGSMFPIPMLCWGLLCSPQTYALAEGKKLRLRFLVQCAYVSCLVLFLL